MNTEDRRVDFYWDIGSTNTYFALKLIKPILVRTGADLNLIPLNPTPGWPTRGSSPNRVREFAAELVNRGINATVRLTRGLEIDAACGQLRASLYTVDIGTARSEAPPSLPE